MGGERKRVKNKLETISGAVVEYREALEISD